MIYCKKHINLYRWQKGSRIAFYRCPRHGVTSHSEPSLKEPCFYCAVESNICQKCGEKITLGKDS